MKTCNEMLNGVLQDVEAQAHPILVQYNLHCDGNLKGKKTDESVLGKGNLRVNERDEYVLAEGNLRVNEIDQSVLDEGNLRVN